jgi:hypothetical protein
MIASAQYFRVLLEVALKGLSKAFLSFLASAAFPIIDA